MASNEATVVFTPLNKIMDESVLAAKIKEIEAAIALEKGKGDLNPLALQQYAIQLDWLKTGTGKGSVPHIEFVLFSRGLVKPDPEASYFVLSSGLQVRFYSLLFRPQARVEVRLNCLRSIRLVVALW